jgi:hypothetical protein
MIMEQLLTTEELAKRMRVNPSTVRRWRLDDVGPPYLRVGTVYRYPASSVSLLSFGVFRGQVGGWQTSPFPSAGQDCCHAFAEEAAGEVDAG